MGCVDRNSNAFDALWWAVAVAPRMGCVDRNRFSRGVRLPLFLSHPAWGAWIEITRRQLVDQIPIGRTPHGVRGSKWIIRRYIALNSESRTPHGVRGSKWNKLWDEWLNSLSRTPHGVRGSKCH